ncbi:COX15/CtaA family protein [Rubrimonas cliftonensis]|uniref:Heme A synthase n=1 Tax=Rubrimonas cliftonensis TaxID=89524 RepID=A0A1H4FDD7_9RHOB|nr:COX15/CtaA family protein [Rubrimonas cliftonensis]SEA95296.1 cytochrome c oxidase assembly protein subunit 15 [Rubrimonas cliftonensis]
MARQAARPRAIFEEVGGSRADAAKAAPVPGAAEKRKARGRRLTALWLFVLAALVCAMVLVGGMTRLTDSGLSMVSWHPVLEAIPPLTEADWAEEFAKYQTTEQYRALNAWMTVEDFKPIYWWEWGHRQFGRVIGLVWLVGLGALLALRMLPSGYLWPVVAPGLLGGVQAVAGMWMVQSGVEAGSTLVSVAPYRLALHLSLAFLILGLLLWPAWRLMRPEWAQLQARRRRLSGQMVWSGALVALCFAQIVLGALVAGNDAGRGYIDWPLMDGAILPPEAFDLSPVWRNLIEGAALTQFNHRVAGYALAVLPLVWVLFAKPRRWAGLAALAIWAQMAWGVVTVMNAAPLEYAIFHQAGALLTFAVVLRARFVAAYPDEVSVRG